MTLLVGLNNSANTAPMVFTETTSAGEVSDPSPRSPLCRRSPGNPRSRVDICKERRTKQKERCSFFCIFFRLVVAPRWSPRWKGCWTPNRPSLRVHQPRRSKRFGHGKNWKPLITLPGMIMKVDGRIRMTVFLDSSILWLSPFHDNSRECKGHQRNRPRVHPQSARSRCRWTKTAQLACSTSTKFGASRL